MRPYLAESRTLPNNGQRVRSHAYNALSIHNIFRDSDQIRLGARRLRPNIHPRRALHPSYPHLFPYLHTTLDHTVETEIESVVRDRKYGLTRVFLMVVERKLKQDR